MACSSSGIKSNQGEVRTHPDGVSAGEIPSGTGSYHIQTPEPEPSLYHVLTHAAIPCDELDTIIVNRLMEHVRESSKNRENIEEYEKTAEKQRAERQRKIKQIETSIKDIDREQTGLTRSLGKLEMEIEEAEAAGDEETRTRKMRRKKLIEEQIDALEDERQKLLTAKVDLTEEAESDLDSLDEEIQDLEAVWQTKTFEKRRTLMNFLVKEVITDVVSTHWVKVEVLWLHEEWGREEMFYYRRRGKNTDWTAEEIALVKAHYATMPRLQLMALLPHRGWHAIRNLGIQLKLPRTQIRSSKDEETMKGLLGVLASSSDLEFMLNHSIPFDAQRTNWVRRC